MHPGVSISCSNAILNFRMKKWATSIPLNWSLNEESLNEAIANFGKVDMEGVLLLPNSEQSTCLPARYVLKNMIVVYK